MDQFLQEALATIYDKEWRSLADEQRAEVARLVGKWSWYLGEGTKEHPLKPIPAKMWPMMAMMFENQTKFNPPPRSMFEATVKTDISLPVKYTLPVIRAVWPALIMNRIAGVQPMPATSGGTMSVFWKHTYREDVTPETNVTLADSDYAVGVENSVPKRLRMEITSQSVSALKRILNATWSTEVQEDAMGALGIDVGQELLDDMGQEILRELEQIVIAEIWAGAAAGNVTWDDALPAGATYSLTDHYQTLFHALVDADNLLYAQRYRRADYVLCGATLAGYLDKAKMWSSTPSERESPSTMESGVQFMGNISRRWDVFQTPYLGVRDGVMGFYPRSQTDTGYIWAPYVPLMPMPRQYGEMLPYDDPDLPGAIINTDKWTQNVRTRNAKLLCQPAMFARISVV
jgi:hypothetical protein